jgi:hypothetical protein
MGVCSSIQNSLDITDNVVDMPERSAKMMSSCMQKTSGNISTVNNSY